MKVHKETLALPARLEEVSSFYSKWPVRGPCARELRMDSQPVNRFLSPAMQGIEFCQWPDGSRKWTSSS